MKPAVVVLVVVTLLLPLFVNPADAQVLAAADAKIDPEVQASLAALRAGQMIDVIVTLHEQEDLTKFHIPDKFTRLNVVIKKLQSRAVLSQLAVRAMLTVRKLQGSVGRVTPLWIVSAISITATRDVILELAARPDVARISPDIIEIVPTSGVPAGLPELNLTVINAPAVWDLGYLGQGVVIAGLDTGVDISHPDLTAKWRGGTNSWYDPYGQHPFTPADLSGHGTSTMGVIVGGDASGYSIGVAPQAQWIAAKIFNDSGSATATAIHQAYQWVLDPDGNPDTADAPDVVNSSWTKASPGCYLDFQRDLQALRAGGILPVFAAGNFGPAGSTSASPANNPEAFAVGATDNTDQIAYFSSIGPSNCSQTQGLFPEVVAPGVDIVTTDRFGLYTIAGGTSLSAPHVAGSLALLLSANPTLTAAQQEQALINSAVDLGDAGPDNVYGYGRIDDLAALNYISGGPVTSNLGASPNPSSDAQSVYLSGTVISNRSTVAGAEFFIDRIGHDGSGLPMAAGDGAFDSASEGVSAEIPASILQLLTVGPHNIYVHGIDADGKWGLVGGTGLAIVKNPPVISGLAVTPNPTNGAASVTLTASASSTGTSIAGAEWFRGVDPGAGLGTPMTATDGAYNSATESLTALVSVAGWGSGSNTLYVRARDAYGSWGAASSVVLNVSQPDAIFADGYESASFSAWSSVSNPGGRITVTTGSKQAGTYGMNAQVSGGASGYVQDNSPAAETSYHARFYFNPASLSNVNTTARTIFTGLSQAGQTVFTVQIRRSGGNYQVNAVVSRAGGTSATNWYAIGNAAFTAIEIGWQSGSAASFSLYAGGVLRQTLTGLNTSAYTLETARLGPQGSLGTVTGAAYFDSFASKRATVVGP